VKRKLVGWLVLVLGLAGGAHAAYAAPTAAPIVAGEQYPGMKSPGTARTLSIVCFTAPIVVGTVLMAASSESNPDPTEAVVGVALFAGGFLVGPSAGHFYAGNSGHALAGIGIRVGTIAALTGLTAASYNDSDGSALVALAGVGGVTVLWWSITHDISSASDAARKHNGEVRAREAQIGLGPVGADHAPGIIVTAAF
jgi:hypothetical protein